MNYLLALLGKLPVRFPPFSLYDQAVAWYESELLCLDSPELRLAGGQRQGDDLRIAG